MLAFVGPPLSVDNLMQPWHWLHLSLQQHEALPWAGLISIVLSKGPISP